MKNFKKPLQIFLIVVAALQLTACSRTVEWEEEVPLNTGETIVVKRSGTYSWSYSAGSGHVGYSPDWKSTIEFTYKGRSYTHTDDAGLVLLAIAPDGLPTLVADASNHDWQWKHKYYCVTPYYVQFRPDSTGKHWIWPERIDPWLHGLPTNLIFGLMPLEVSGKKLLSSDRAVKNASMTGSFKELKSIDPTFTTNICPRKN